ncbi:MAG: hypothetical protein IKA64_02605 [Clostridia bacterium]|nr:hypothetical protein [Clostridia bacterium]
MKRISILVLLILSLVVCFVACKKEEPHEHSYTDEWCVDANYHWHVADCGHEDKITSKFEHKNTDGNGTCDQCGYKVAWTVTVDAVDEVTVADEVYVDKTAGNATFTASASTSYRLNVDGATLVGAPTVADGVATYTYKVTASADADVTIDVTRINFVTASDTKSDIALDEETNAAEAVFEAYLEEGIYAIKGWCDAELWAGITLTDAEGNTIWQDWDLGGYVIETAGVYTLKVSVTDEDAAYASVDLGYYAVSMLDMIIELDTAEDAGYVFANGIEYIITVPVAESGMYKMSTTAEDVSIDSEAGVCYTYLEAGTAAFIIRGEGTALTYEFDWKLEKLTADVTLENGENDVTIPVGEIVVVEFVAPAKGFYTFASAKYSSMLTYSFEAGYMDIVWTDAEYKLAEGDSMIILVRTYSEEPVEETITVSYREPNPSFTVEITNDDTYTFNARYEFTAEVSGTYTFFFPEGVSVGMADVIDNDGAPFLNLYGWDEPTYVDGLFAYDVEIAAGDSVTFAFMAFEAGELEITYLVDEHEVSGGGDIGGGDVGGGDEDVILDANGLGGEYSFTFVAVFELNFMPDAAGATSGYLSVVDGNNAANSGMFAYEIVDGAYVFYQGGEVTNSVIVSNNGYMWTFQNPSLRMPQEFAEYNAPAGGDDTQATALVIGNNEIAAADVTFEYTADAAGTLNLAAGAAIGGMVEMWYSVNGGEATVLELQTNVDLTLAAGDVVTVIVDADGYSSLTATWTAA